ncbi:hypothetical protein N8X83_00800 [Alphaproteobacteria bacterium]|nr:hypothetical protein [Alphaproteobacteria bacterium]
MNNENKKILWNKILEAGDFLKDRLPRNDNHPNGRNSYAHIAIEIKNKFKNSYKDISDDKIDEVNDYIEYLKKNPN